jgi:polysaccharide biosynthesis transport protein
MSSIRSYAEGRSVEGREIRNMLRRQRWVIAACMLAGIGAGAAVAHSHDQTYTGSVVLRVDEKRAVLPSLDARTLVATGNQVGAEMEVLRSRTLAGLVVDSLRLQARLVGASLGARGSVLAAAEVDPDAPAGVYRFESVEGGQMTVADGATGERLGVAAPGAWVRVPGAKLLLQPTAPDPGAFEVSIVPREDAIDAFGRSLKVRRPAQDAGIIRLEYHSADRDLARAAPDLLAARFITLRQRSNQAESRSTIGFLRGQLDTIGTQLAATELELQTFREAAGVVDIEEERGARVRLLTTLKAERDAIEAERSALAQLVRQVDALAATPGAAGPSPYRRLIAFPALLRNQAASDLVRSLTRIEDERAEVANRRKADDPEMRALDDRVRDLEEWLRSTVATYLEGLTNQVQAIDAQLVGYQQELARIPAREMQLTRLSRQATLQEEIFSHLQRRLKEAEVVNAAEDPSVRLIDSATVVAEPMGLKRALSLAFLGLVGLFVGMGAGLAREYLDGSVRSRQDLHVATGLPVLGLIPRIEAVTARKGRALGQPDVAGERIAGEGSPGVSLTLSPPAHSPPTPPLLADSYLRLNLNIEWARNDSGARSILFTSPLPRDGKTTTALNFATAMALGGKRVLVVDGDMRHSALSRQLGLHGRPGLADLLASPVLATGDAIHPIQLADGLVLDCLPAGRGRSDPGHLLQLPPLAMLTAWARATYDLVVFDSPPSTVVSDAFAISRCVDGVVLVTRAAVTPFEAVALAAEELRNARAPVLGTVLNDIRLERDTTYDRAYKWYVNGKAYEYAS